MSAWVVTHFNTSDVFFLRGELYIFSFLYSNCNNYHSFFICFLDLNCWIANSKGKKTIWFACNGPVDFLNYKKHWQIRKDNSIPNKNQFVAHTKVRLRPTDCANRR